MKIKDEFFEVAKDAKDVDGRVLEPEAQPAQIIQNTSGPIALGKGGETVAEMPFQIARPTTVGELADKRSRLCYLCKHFRNDRWVKLIGDAAEGIAPTEEKDAVMKMRGGLIALGFADAEEDESAADEVLMTLGICGPMTEHERATDSQMGPKELVVVFPTACCPLNVVTPTSPQGFFEPKDRESAEAAGMNKDAVFLTVAGKERAP